MKKLLSAVLAGVMLFSVATTSYSAYLDDYVYVLPKEYYDYPEFEWEVKQGHKYLPNSVTDAANLWYKFEGHKEGEVWPEEYLTVFEGYMDGAELGSDGFTLYGYEWKNGKLSVDFGATFDVKYNWSTGMSYTVLYGPTADDYIDYVNALAVAVTNKNDGSLVRMIDSGDTFIPELKYDEYNSYTTNAWQFLSLEEAKAFEESKGMELEYTTECRKTVEISLPDDFSPELYDVTVYYVDGCRILGMTVYSWKFSVPYEISLSDYAPAGLTLAEGSHLVLDSATGYVDKIDGTITVGELKANFAGDVSVAGKADDALVATDDAVGDYKALIYGDVDRNGKVNLSDASVILQKIAGWEVNLNEDAADVNKSGDVDLTDITKILKKLADWDDISLGNVRLVFENKALTAENEYSAMDLYFETPLVRHGASNRTHTGEYSYKIKMARGEYESCQVFVQADKAMEGLTIELSEFEHEFGEGTLDAELLIHFYYKLGVHSNVLGDNYPGVGDYDDHAEPLLPLADSFEIAEGKNQGFHINVKSDENSAPGMYKATLTVKDADGKSIKQASVYTYVWDFELPVTPYSASAFSIGWYDIATLIPSYNQRDPYDIYKDYYDFLLENNVTGYSMPYKVTDPRADAYMDDPRVTYFTFVGGDNIFSTAQNDEETVAFYNKIITNPEWKKKAAAYLVDEPYGPDGAKTIVEKYTRLTELLGTRDYQVIMPHGNSMMDNVNCIDTIAFVGDWVDILVPITAAFKPNFETPMYNETIHTPRPAFSKYGESADRYRVYKEQGKTLWWYVCCSPQFPFPNLTVNQQGVMNRVLWWQQFMFDIDGFLYWSVNADWGKLPGNLHNEYPALSGGDGNLLYYGERYGRSGPVLGWRFVHVRDGFDDFDYLRIAEELVGREEVLKIVHRYTTGVVKVTEDASVMESCRDEVAKLIVSASKK